MIPKECRDLLQLCLEVASNTDSEDLARMNIERATGMINYALTRGDITSVEHGNEMAWVYVVKATRENASRT